MYFDSDFASFSLLSLQSFTCGPQNLPLSPSSRLFIAKQGIYGHDSLPRRVELAQVSCYFIVKQPCLHKRASYFFMKLFGGPGEPKASPGEPGIRKSFEMTLLPSLLAIFRIIFRNIEKPFGLPENWCQPAQFG